jgi:hypothetical protein
MVKIKINDITLKSLRGDSYGDPNDSNGHNALMSVSS